MYSISVYLATITVVQSPFSLKGGASSHSGRCESSPLASEDMEMLVHPSTQPIAHLASLKAAASSKFCFEACSAVCLSEQSS